MVIGSRQWPQMGFEPVVSQVPSFLWPTWSNDKCPDHETAHAYLPTHILGSALPLRCPLESIIFKLKQILILDQGRKRFWSFMPFLQVHRDHVILFFMKVRCCQGVSTAAALGWEPWPSNPSLSLWAKHMAKSTWVPGYSSLITCPSRWARTWLCTTHYFPSFPTVCSWKLGEWHPVPQVLGVAIVHVGKLWFAQHHSHSSQQNQMGALC
jgi:hypothetical protein